MNTSSISENFLGTLIEWLATAGIRIVISIVVLIVSFKIINVIGKKIARSSDKGKLDKTLAKTFAYIFKLSAKFIIAVCLVGFIGIDTSGLAALVASIGVGAGLALNGALSNFAGGVLIILTRPFGVDDFIEAEGYTGTVEDIHITYTRVRTPDNKVIYIPNGKLSAGNIVNYSEKDERRVDFNFSVSYDSDIDRVKRIITEQCTAHDMVLLIPEPMVRISEHGSNGINITTRVWVKSDNYWKVYFDIIESVKASFDKEGIRIPYRQLDVHVKE